MSIRIPSKSIFRPERQVDRAILHEHKALIEKINRRNVLRGTLSLGALTLLTGCDVTESDQVQTVLRAVSAWNDRVQALIFRPNHLAPTYPASRVVKPPRFNAYYGIDEVKPVDGSLWRLELSGRNRRQAPVDSGGHPRAAAAGDDRQAHLRRGLGLHRTVVRAELEGLLARIGADLTAKYVYFHCADDFTESIDMATALHPQTILATKYANGTITDPFGYPLRLRTSTKLGYKNAKWIKAIEVTNTFTETFWSKQGENWFAGI